MIRSAVPGDAAALAVVHVAVWGETYPGLLPANVIAGRTLEQRRALWTRVLAEGARDVFVALADDALVGFACGGPMRATAIDPDAIAGYDAYLDALYVLGARQHGGVGRALLAALAARLHERGLSSLALHVVAANPACAFYERLGARLIDEQTVVEDDGARYEVRSYGWSDLRTLASRPGR